MVLFFSFFNSLSSTKGTVSLQSLITQLAFKSHHFVNNCVFSREDQDKGTMQVNHCHGPIIYLFLLKRKKITPLLSKTQTNNHKISYCFVPIGCLGYYI